MMEQEVIYDEPETTFIGYARLLNLGEPESQECHLTQGGKTWRIQAFTRGLVFCLMGDEKNIRFVSW